MRTPAPGGEGEKLVLASASPRRRLLLESLGYDVIVRASEILETSLASEAAPDMAVRLATEKAAACPEDHLPVVAADTVVHCDGRSFPKPTDPEGAQAILALLSGRWHAVTTGFCVRNRGRQVQRAVTTRVLFRPLPPSEIRRYVETGEPMDKAGAYGIQGRGGALVRSLEGSYTNVVGLPVEEVIEALVSLGVARPG